MNAPNSVTFSLNNPASVAASHRAEDSAIELEWIKFQDQTCMVRGIMEQIEHDNFVRVHWH